APEQWPTHLPEPGVLSIAALDPPDLRPGEVSAATGRAAFTYIERSIEAALAGEVDAVATGPIHKEALRAAGISFPGHTEIFTDRTRAPRSCMLLTCPQITCSFVTVHVGYRDVPALLSVQRVLDVI